MTPHATNKATNDSNHLQDKIIVLEEIQQDKSVFRFPFPVKQDLCPPQDLYRNTVKRLRSYINFLKEDSTVKNRHPDTFLTETGANYKSSGDQKSEKQLINKQNTKIDVESLLQENDQLKSKLQDLQLNNKALINNTGAVKLNALMDEKIRLQQEVQNLRERTDNLELECAGNQFLKKELKKKEAELLEYKSLIQDYQVSSKLKTPVTTITNNR